MGKIIGFLGPKNSGKSTATKYLIKKYGFTKEIFADPIKDTCANLFSWDRAMLDGDTIESRKWREEIDSFWAEILNIPDFSPRKALNIVGTEMFRNILHQDFWVISSFRKHAFSESNIVFGDCRHINETSEIIKNGGFVAKILNGPLPIWADIALEAIAGAVEAIDYMERLGIHRSEYEWLAAPYTHVIMNDADIQSFENKIDEFYKDVMNETDDNL